MCSSDLESDKWVLSHLLKKEKPKLLRQKGHGPKIKGPNIGLGPYRRPETTENIIIKSNRKAELLGPAHLNG